MSARRRGDPVVLGIDIGTTNAKGLACLADGTVVARTERSHRVERPAPGHVEHDAERVWWEGAAILLTELGVAIGDPGRVRAIAVTSCGPCLVPVDGDGVPLRRGILYGVDTRATAEIADLESRVGPKRVHRLGGMALTSQSLVPKLAWVVRHEPSVARRVDAWHTATSFVVGRLTGVARWDRHQAAYAGPLYDARRHRWDLRHADALPLAGTLPDLAWPGDIAGGLTGDAAARTGLPVGTPVLVGTSDGPLEALALGALARGTVAVTHGSTTTATTFGAPRGVTAGLWVTDGLSADQACVGAGLSASGLLLDWAARTFVPDRPLDEARMTILRDAAASPPGARGLLVVPSFAGERAPVDDPLARGVVAGLTLDHTRADVARAILESIGLAVTELLAALEAAGLPVDRVRTAGGATRDDAILQAVADATGRSQEVSREPAGAALGAARLAAESVGLVDAAADWFRPARRIEPDLAAHRLAVQRAPLLQRLARDVRPTVHRLATGPRA